MEDALKAELPQSPTLPGASQAEEKVFDAVESASREHIGASELNPIVAPLEDFMRLELLADKGAPAPPPVPPPKLVPQPHTSRPA